MSNITTLDISGLKQDYYDNVSSFVADFKPKNDVKDPGICENLGDLNRKLHAQGEQLITEAQMLVNGYTKQLANALFAKLRESRESIQNLLTSKRSEMEDKIKASADEYLAELQSKIDEYKRNQEVMDEKFRLQNDNINQIKQLL